jgi:transcriptional regulator with XRE-family HTH domain
VATVPLVGSRLAALLAQRGMSQVQLCDRSGVSRQTVSNAYHGNRPVSLETWIRLANALNVSVSEIAPAAAAARIAAVA